MDCHLQSLLGFNSLQTGKCIQSVWTLQRRGTTTQFQFPSNGKVYSKLGNYENANGGAIRFQFPSNGKVYSKAKIAEMMAGEKSSFNSLQTGKCIQSVDTNAPSYRHLAPFQFPSNGKVYSKSPYFKPSGVVAPEAPKYTRTARGIFLAKFQPQNPANPRVH